MDLAFPRFQNIMFYKGKNNLSPIFHRLVNEAYRICYLCCHFRLPPISLPNFSLMAKIFPDAFVMAVVIFATNISVAKILGQKDGYSVDPNQVCMTKL